MNHPALSEAESAIRAGMPRSALTALTLAVKASPGDVRLRIFLAQLLCVLGQWDRAHTQLNVAADLDATVQPMREMVGHALRCELMRAAVFEGRRSPMIFGQPDEWMALLIESLLQAGQGQQAQAQGLADRAFEAAPASAGRLNGQPFAWIADADSRLGPVLEAMINGRYYWLPFSRLSHVRIEAPTDLRDIVWLPATVTFINGGEAIAMLPTRYPGTERSGEDALLMARQTAWQPAGAERWFGLGQRVLVTDQGEHDLLGIREIELNGHG
ncbi:type VI secretion system accessory protein TagJ [Aquariibacter albus]|uniref:Tetratricopeptide repeat protein n=1 Tax=Aquariibacter albus TaxID=2759899 RepID=A0A839HUB7_9BURK|nr:type VI secretion system accessory protein TagJ [Aquariibacter albus]MBB1163159.1 tetratricopeptide repeat protein [Aquariibacter albus]